MERSEAKTRFTKADRLYALGRFEDALEELNAIDDHYPNNHRILNAQARTLARLWRHDEAIALCDRLLEEFNYEKARALREAIVLEKQNGPPVSQSTTNAHVQKNVEETSTMETAEKRFKIKPLRLIILIALISGMYLEYIPLWLGIGLLVFYFGIKLLIGAAITRLFSAPFKMKGKVLAGAECTLHGFEWTDGPPSPEDDSDDEAAPQEPLRYVWLDVTITPQPATSGFTHWEPGELMLAPADFKLKDLDSLESCYQVYDSRMMLDGIETEDEEGKYTGPQRVKLLVGVPENERAFKFVYYFEHFGHITLDG